MVSKFTLVNFNTFDGRASIIVVHLYHFDSWSIIYLRAVVRALSPCYDCPVAPQDVAMVGLEGCAETQAKPASIY